MARINLIPKSISRQRREKGLRILKSILAVLIILLIVNHYINMLRKVNYHKEHLAQIESNLENFKSLLDEKKQLDEINTNINYLSNIFDEINENSYIFHDKMKEIMDLIPNEIRLLTFRYQREGFNIIGFSTGNRPISELMIMLGGLPYIESLDLKGIYLNVGNIGKYRYNFEINGKLK